MPQHTPPHPLLGPLFGRPPPGVMPPAGPVAIRGERCPKRQVEAALRHFYPRAVLMDELRDHTGLNPRVITASVAKLITQDRAQKAPSDSNNSWRKVYKWKPHIG